MGIGDSCQQSACCTMNELTLDLDCARCQHGMLGIKIGGSWSFLTWLLLFDWYQKPSGWLQLSLWPPHCSVIPMYPNLPPPTIRSLLCLAFQKLWVLLEITLNSWTIRVTSFILEKVVFRYAFLSSVLRSGVKKKSSWLSSSLDCTCVCLE